MAQGAPHRDKRSPPLTGASSQAVFAEHVDDIAVTVARLANTRIEFFGRYEIHEQPSSRTVTVPSAVQGFTDVEKAYHFRAAGGGQPLLVVVPACQPPGSDLMAGEQLEFIGLYSIHGNRPPRTITLPQRVSAFAETDRVYQFQITHHPQPLVVAPA